MSLYFLSNNLGKTPTAITLNASFPWTLVVSQTHILIPQCTQAGLTWGPDCSSDSSPVALSLWSVIWVACGLGSVTIHNSWVLQQEMGTSDNIVYVCVHLNHPCIYSGLCRAKRDAAPSSWWVETGVGWGKGKWREGQNLILQWEVRKRTGSPWVFCPSQSIYYH